MPSANGKFAFICYLDPTGKDHQYGPQAALKAVEAMNGQKLGKDEKELYVTFAQSKVQRQIEVQKMIMNLKQSKKRCNLLVRGFPETWEEKDIRDLFSKHGKIENIKLLFPQKGAAGNTNQPAHSAFVCYEQPSEASEAKMTLHGKTIDGKSLEIKQYEIKELKDIQNLIARDRSDFERFLEQMKGVNISYSDITNTPGMTQILQQVLQLAHQSMSPQMMHGPGRGGYPGGGRGRGGAPRGGMQNRGPPPMAMGPQGGMPQPPMGMPQPSMPMPAMPTPPGMPPMMQGMPPQMMQGQMTLPQEYQMKAAQLIPSIQPNNRVYKQKVGELIYNYIAKMAPADKVPRLTGMLLELSLDQIREYLGSYQVLSDMVQEGLRLIESQSQ